MELLGRRLRRALSVNELRIEIDAAVPFDRIKSHSHVAEVVVVGELLKNAEVEMGLHVEQAFLAVIECDAEREILVRHDLGHGRMHGGRSSRSLSITGELAFVDLAADRAASGGLGITDRRSNGILKRRCFSVKGCVWLPAVLAGRAVVGPRFVKGVGSLEKIS